MRSYWLWSLVLCGLSGCDGGALDAGTSRSAVAERFFRGVYGCDPGVVPALAADSVAISYPMFEELFTTPAIRGKERVAEFATGFCGRWKDAEVTVHEALGDDDQVVLIWSFAARNVATGTISRWGGISWFRFDSAGRILSEIGEESTPGPLARLTATGAAR